MKFKNDYTILFVLGTFLAGAVTANSEKWPRPDNHLDGRVRPEAAARRVTAHCVQELSKHMYENLYKKIQKSCGYVTVVLDDEIISEGSCFAFTPDGEVITAAHVVTGRVPIRKEDYSDPNAKIFVKFLGRPVIEYQVSFCSLSIQCEAFTEVIQLDIAALVPKTKEEVEFSYLPARIVSPNLGELAFISGFSDELSLPFNIDKIAKKDFPGMQEFLSAMKKGYMADMTGPLIKRAYVGNHRRIFAEDSAQNVTIEVDVFYLDSGANSGASGGPVVNENGEAIGVISQRAVTSVSQESAPGLKVPAGATIALSLHPLGIIHQLRKTYSRSSNLKSLLRTH